MADEIIFNDVKYKAYPSHRYFQCTSRREGKQRYLHRAIWEYHNGPIEEGYHIHHIDGNCQNNDINNLELVFGPDHNREHSLNSPHLKSEERKELLDRIRPLSHEWHKTDEGRKALSQIAFNKPIVRKNCLNCGSVYETKNPTQAKYCSKKCGRQFRLKVK